MGITNQDEQDKKELENLFGSRIRNMATPLKNMKSQEQKLFELVESIGEILSGDLHIIENTDYPTHYEGEAEYRVYHSAGYCFDVFKQANTDDETDEIKSFDYSFYEEWEGFDKINTAKQAIALITKSIISIIESTKQIEFKKTLKRILEEYHEIVFKRMENEKNKSMKPVKYVKCYECKGDGKVPRMFLGKEYWVPCDLCRGQGTIPDPDDFKTTLSDLVQAKEKTYDQD